MRLLLSLLLLLLAGLSISRFLDAEAAALTEQSLTRALIAFGSARGLNGAISVAQGTEFAFQPGGLGVVLTPGQILDPVNDLIERFSWVMLAASTSLGIQKVLLSMSEWRYFSYLTAATFLLCAVLIWLPRTPQRRQVVYKIALTLLLLRFGIAIVAVGTELVFSIFLESRYQEAAAQLDSTSARLRQLNVEEVTDLTREDDTSVLKRLYSQVSTNLNLRVRLEYYQALAETTCKSAIDLVVVFLFQTIIFPVVFLVLLFSLTRKALRV